MYILLLYFTLNKKGHCFNRDKSIFITIFIQKKTLLKKRIYVFFLIYDIFFRYEFKRHLHLGAGGILIKTNIVHPLSPPHPCNVSIRFNPPPPLY